MKQIAFNTIDWRSVRVTAHPGETGFSWWKTIQCNDLRIRMVEYSINYKADHWCTKGHIVYCIEGEMVSELLDGRMFTLSAGMTYQVSDDASAHRSHSKDGAKLLIIDGGFLKNKIEANPWKI